MPMYEYQCSSCNQVLEIIQKFSDEPLQYCPDCGQKGTMGKLISQTSFQLKGSGWYNTDYRKPKTEAKAECKGEPKSCDGPCAAPKAAEKTPA